jgi:ATP-dependent protease ClpP protease subunit
MTRPKLHLPPKPKGLRLELPRVRDGALFAVNAAAEQATITIFDVIGADVTASRVAAALRQIGDRPVTLQINSPGGDYFEGAAIYNLLRGHSKPVTAQVLGLAASAASIVTMGAGRIEMARNASLMIHNVWVLMVGDANALAAGADFLRQFDAQAAEIYGARSGLAANSVHAMMDAETWFDAGQALAQGFADGLLDRDGDPPLTAEAATAPQTKRDLETALRSDGLSKAEAERLIAGGWPAMRREQDPALDQLADLLQAQAREIATRVKGPCT